MSDWIEANDPALLKSIEHHEGGKTVVYAMIRNGSNPPAPNCNAEACMAAGLWPAYLDTKGLPTVGIGHLITGNEPADPNQGLTDQQVMDLLAEDVAVHLQGAKDIATEKGMSGISGNTVVQVFMTEMCFNMGRPRYLGFNNGLKKLTSAVNGNGQYSYNEAADEHLDSGWARQVGQRAIDMCNTLRALD